MDSLQKQLDNLIEYERRAEEVREDGRKDTLCGFGYGNGSCNVCMYHSRCREVSENADRNAWKMETRVMIEYQAMERKLRRNFDYDDKASRELLARLLRAMSRNEVVISEEDEKRLKEAEDIFEQLYNQTAEMRFRDEAESCRLLLNRR